MLPDLTNIKVAGLDTETYDPGLTKIGPGFLKGRGSYMIGFSYAIQKGPYGYVPTRHSHGNYEGPWHAWLKELCADHTRRLVFANAKYDLEVLWSVGIEVKACIVDIQTNEALLNENERSYSLAAIAERRNLPAKGTATIEQALLDHGFAIATGKGFKPDWSRLRDLPVAIVANYAELDAALTLAIYEYQLDDLARDGLNRVAALESDLLPIFWQMRLNGVNVDVGAAENLNFELQAEHMEALNSLVSDSGYPVDPFASRSLSKWVQHLGYTPPKTKKGEDSVTNEWMESRGNPYLDRMVEYRKGEKIRRDFVDALVIENSQDGKVHPSWFSTRGGSWSAKEDEFQGTRTGRPSCTDPNLTQIPARHPRFGPAVRGLFKPANGGQWGKFDYSAQEPRITVHYAHLLGMPGAGEIWAIYQSNPYTDYHQATCDLVKAVTGLDIGRFNAKTINLALAYGMGRAKLARKLGLSLADADILMEAYHKAMRFVKPLLKHCMGRAEALGYVKTVLGRRRHFDEWESAAYDPGKEWEAPLEDQSAALAKWGNIKRAGCYKALNAIIQGSAAEQTKTAMVQLYKEYDMVPLVQVYDELGYTVYNPEQAQIIKAVMEGVQLFTVPHIVDIKLAEHWSAK